MSSDFKASPFKCCVAFNSDADLDALADEMGLVGKDNTAPAVTELSSQTSVPVSSAASDQQDKDKTEK